MTLMEKPRLPGDLLGYRFTHEDGRVEFLQPWHLTADQVADLRGLQRRGFRIGLEEVKQRDYGTHWSPAAKCADEVLNDKVLSCRNCLPANNSIASQVYSWSLPDGTKMYGAKGTGYVVTPDSTEDIADVKRWCEANGLHFMIPKELE